MESSFNSSETDPLLLLKERIIKTETLLDKYACLTRKFNDLEKSHSEAVENEKKAKKDAIKYLEKYCKLAKKSNCLLNKIKTLEENINVKSNELKESQDEYAKLESVLQVYKTERKGHQYLKKDRDFLLTVLWKVLKRLEEEPKEYKSKKITETFFKRFERELVDLKLEDFRYNKIKNVSRLTEKDESEFLLSPGSQVVDSVEPDFIDTDIVPESVKSSFEESDENYVLEEIKHMDSNHRMLDTEHRNDLKTGEVNVLENQALSLPNLSFDPFISQEFEDRINLKPQEKHVLKDCVFIHTSENNGVNLRQNGEENGSFTSVASLYLSTEGGSISDTEIQSHVQDQSYLNLKDKHFTLQSKDKVKKELRKTPVKFGKSYCSKKFQSLSHTCEIMGQKHLENFEITNMGCSPNEANAILNTISNFKSANIDIFNVSSETINLDTDVSVEDIGSIPDHISYCDKIYDFLTSSESYTKERSFYDEDSYLLFLTENELVNKLREVNFDADKALIRKSSKMLSVFDIEDSGSSTPSGCVRDEELANTCVEFISDNGNTKDLKEVNRVCEEEEKDDFIEGDEISKKTKSENQVDKKSQKISNFSLKEININCNSDQFIGGTINKNLPNLEFTQEENNMSDEEIYRVLNDYKNVPLLSPIKEKEPKNRRQLFTRQSPKHDKCNLSKNIKVMGDLTNMESCKEVVRNTPNGEEEKLAFNPKMDKGKEKQMVDKFVQTDNDCFLEHKTERRGSGVNEATVFPENLMRKLCKIVWKRNLKKFKHLKSFDKMCKVHSSCFDFMRTLMKIINHSSLYLRNRTSENSHFINRKMGQSTSNLKYCERGVSSWQVEDVEENNVISKNEPLFNYPKIEDCSFFTQVPTHYYSKDRLHNSTVKSEESRSQKSRISCNWSVSNQPIEFETPTSRKPEIDSNACEYNVCQEYGIDSDVALQHCHSNYTVNNVAKRCEDSEVAHDVIKTVENTLKLNFENIPHSDVFSSDGLENNSDYLEKCVEVKQTEFQSGEACSKTGEAVLLLRRSSRIRSRNTLLMKGNNRTGDHSLILKESDNLKKVDFFVDSLPSRNGTSMESHEIYSNKSINDILPIKEMPEDSESPALKDKFEELFGQSESPSECSSSESGGNLTPTKVQKEASGNLRINTNSCTSEAVAIRKKRRVCCDNSKADRTCNKKIKWELLSVVDENSEERFPENEVPLNDTFSSQDRIGDNSNILDSIMTAMTKQSEFFKVQTTLKETEVSSANDLNILCAPQPSQSKDCISSASVHRKISNEYRMKGDNSALLNLPYYWSVGNHLGNQIVKEREDSSNSYVNHREESKMKSLVQKEIRNFLNLDINTVEEGEEKIKSCIAALRKANENIIANTIVNEIMANVDEELKEYERPAPPLTQTQHRIMIILTVFSLSDEQFYRISSQILRIIRSKIFPENFFWPDDSLEMASRFYAALCKRLNDFKGIWKFCFKVITSMRQRWCIPILVVLQVWPDIIHNANDVQNNLMVKTFVNIILHTPRSEDMRRKRQEQKLLAIKHLLINFYGFDLNSTIEGFTQKLWESLVSNIQGSADALVLICKCRTWSWTRKNVIAKLVETLESWMKGEAPDVMVSEVLDILQQITTIFPEANAPEASSAKDIVSVLSQALGTEKLNPISEEKIIKILCAMCHYSDVRDILQQFLEKRSSSEPLYADIQKALSSKKSKCKEICRRANTKIVRMQRGKSKPKKKQKKKKKNSSRQKSVLDIK